MPADSCFNLLEVVMRHCTAQQRFDKEPAAVLPTELVPNIWKRNMDSELAHSEEIMSCTLTVKSSHKTAMYLSSYLGHRL